MFLSRSYGPAAGIYTSVRYLQLLNPEEIIMSFFVSKSTYSQGMFVLLIASAILNGIAFMYVHFVPAVLACAIVYYALIKSGHPRDAFFTGAVFGGFSSLLLNYWMIPVVAHYGQASLLPGLLCYLASSLVLAFFFGIQFYMYAMIRYPESSRRALVYNPLLAAALWVVFEWIRAWLFSAMPWMSFSTGITQGRFLYLIQPAAYGGVFLLSFLIVLASCIAAQGYETKNLKSLPAVAGVFAIQLIAGYYLYTDTGNGTDIPGKQRFSVALVMPGLSPEAVWNEKTADDLVGHLFSLNEKAVAQKPALLVWTETVVPWTYSSEDDFINALAKGTREANIHTLIGMNSAVTSSGGTLCNSVYLLDPAGRESGRYDKQDLLTLVEKPLGSVHGSLILPFLTNYDVRMKPGHYKGPVETPWGKAGIMVCNESTSFFLANDLVMKGAGFLVNVGNDNWFSDHFITRQHFYNCRLRAVENRKDMIINNNMGTSGIVRANGEIVLQADGKKHNVRMAEVYPNQLPGCHPTVFICFIVFILVCAALRVPSFYHLFQTKQL